MAISITKKDLVWSYAGYLLNAGIGIILLPLILHFLPQTELGLWYNFASIGALVSLLDFGFMPTITRNITYCWAGATEIRREGLADPPTGKEPNFQLLNTVICTCKKIYLFIAVTALVLLFTIGSVYIRSITNGLSGPQYFIAWVVYSLGIFLNIYYSYWGAFLRGVGAVKEGQKSLIISKVTQICISMVGLFSGFGLIALSVAYVISGLVLRQISKYFFFSYKNLKKELSKNDCFGVDKKTIIHTFNSIWYNAWRLGLVSFGAYLITQANTIVCSVYLGLEITASYGLTMQLFGFVTSFSCILFNSYQPLLSEARLVRDYQKLKKIFSFSVVISWITFIIGGLVIIIFGSYLLNLIGSKTTILNTNILVYMCLYLFLESNHSIFASFITTGNNVPFVKASLISGGLIVMFSILLIKYTSLGIWSLLLSQSIVQLLYNNWKWPYIVLKELKMN
ncbi:MAG TPA: O-unit flippase-like protein [Bacillota bacterium]|nr:O-unit flippase-like protein [Bacillota bacterium]